MSLKIEKATLKHEKYFRDFETVYFESFPLKERISMFSIYDSLINDKQATIYFMFSEDIFAGFLITYKLKQFLYCEYLAISKKMRGKGLGSIIIEKTAEESAIPIVLEVEPPETETTKKRIRFYKKMGFKYWDLEYAQPAFVTGEKVPLKLMTFGDIPDIHEVRDILYKDIYEIS